MTLLAEGTPPTTLAPGTTGARLLCAALVKCADGDMANYANCRSPETHVWLSEERKRRVYLMSDTNIVQLREFNEVVRITSRKIEAVEQSDKKTKSLQIEVGRLLIELRERVDAGLGRYSCDPYVRGVHLAVGAACFHVSAEHRLGDE